MMKKLMCLGLILILLAGCAPAPSGVGVSPSGELPSSPAGEASPSVAADPGYAFEAGGVTIHMGEPSDPIIEALGEPTFGIFEALSCVFDGNDLIYHYSGFEINTFEMEGKNYVLSVILSDDSLSTPEGLYLGMSLDEMLAIYGDDYTQNFDSYTYTRGDSSLAFIIEENTVASITYRYTGV